MKCVRKNILAIIMLYLLSTLSFIETNKALKRSHSQITKSTKTKSTNRYDFGYELFQTEYSLSIYANFKKNTPTQVQQPPPDDTIPELDISSMILYS